MIRNKNVWIKSDIGTGKSLIFLSLIQYFKNTDYKNLPLTVPLKCDILSTIEHADKKPFMFDMTHRSYYKQIYNMNLIHNEIFKQGGFYNMDN